MTTMNDQEKKSIAPLGKALQDARLKASLTVEEVAEELNLAMSTIRDIEDQLDNAIEDKRYPSIYLRGYLVNYAKLVALGKLNEFPEYQQLSDTQIHPRNLRPSANLPPVKKRGKRLLLSSVFIAVVCLGFFIVQQVFFSESKTVIENTQDTNLKNANVPAEIDVISGKVKEETPNVEVASESADVAVKKQSIKLPVTKLHSQTVISKTSESDQKTD